MTKQHALAIVQIFELDNVHSRCKVRKYLEKMSEVYQEVHDNVTDAMRVMHETGWRLQAWYDLRPRLFMSFLKKKKCHSVHLHCHVINRVIMTVVTTV